MILSDISIKRPVLMTMIVMAFAVVGLFSLVELGIDMLPKIEFPFISVVTIYPGAGPEEIETLITKPIEEEVGAINGVKNIQSVSQEGVSFVFIEFQLEVDVNIAGIDVKEKVDAIRYELPQDAEPPSISKFDLNAMPIIDLAVSSKRPIEEVYKICKDVIKPELAKIEGLANIDLIGGKQREIRIEADKNALAGRDLSLMQIIQSIGGENLNIPSGRIVQGRKEYSIRVEGEFSSIDEIENLKIPAGDGPPVRLGDIAEVKDDFEEQRELARFNNKVSVGLSLVKRADANTVEVSDNVYKSLDKLKDILPNDIDLNIARDRSIFIIDSVADVSSNMVMGILLTALVLLLFLHNWKGTVIAAVSMPISIVSTFTLFRFSGFTINMMTLMGLAISVGILVTNSIVVLENIQRYRSLGLGLKEAASKGTGEIAIAVAAATLTNVVVFTPIAFMSGITGQFFRQFGLTVAFATMFSLLISFTLTPMMASMKITKKVYVSLALVAIWVVYSTMSLTTALIIGCVLILIVISDLSGLRKKADKVWDDTYDNLVESYRRTLAWAISHRKTVILTIVGIFLLSIFLGKFIGSEFFPSSDQGNFSISIEMPSGGSLAETDKVLNKIEEILATVPEIESMYTSLGKSESGEFSVSEGVNLGVIVVQLKSDREASTNDILKRLRPKMAGIPSAKLILAPMSSMGGGGGAGLEIEVSGLDMDKLVSLSNKVKKLVEDTPGTVDINSSWKLGKPELKITPRRSEVADAGTSAGAVAMSLRQMIEGQVSSKFREGGDEYDIRVKLAERNRQSLKQVGEYLISVPDGNVPLERLAKLEYTEGPTNISRKNKQRLVVISANIVGSTIGEVQKSIEARIPELKVEKGYKVYFGGQSEMMAESFGEMLKALLLATILTYMLMAAILESYKNPFVIILTLPLAFIGVILSLLITGKTLSMLSMMAIVMLVGIVVNNGILLLDYIKVLREEGKELREAILEACPIRLRPIIMANAATILGMMPLALGLGAAGETRAPMAIVSIGGLITSTIFTLYLIPVIYASFEGIRKIEKQEKTGKM